MIVATCPLRYHRDMNQANSSVKTSRTSQIVGDGNPGVAVPLGRPHGSSAPGGGRLQMVSMEANSDYWRLWFAVLEDAGLAVQPVSSSQARNLPGRPKTDKEDARWIARLTEMGMLRSSCAPPEIRTLRVCTWHTWDLTADRTRYGSGSW